ncbi:PREDICTED: trefoil factor 1 isoform X1 [Bison bison bison]|uniref:Trefoil factor 1 isoform X1 n=1 Tax=Bison bison bison TaxID=43346 RepID=A0A6P3H285_BISBB|nr:PREDICTED: trefoil factor 1 isoform X1 [Bison bison bison]
MAAMEPKRRVRWNPIKDGIAVTPASRLRSAKIKAVALTTQSVESRGASTLRPWWTKHASFRYFSGGNGIGVRRTSAWCQGLSSIAGRISWGPMNLNSLPGLTAQILCIPN